MGIIDKLFGKGKENKPSAPAIEPDSQAITEAETYYQQGCAKVKSNNPGGAIADFTRAIGLNPNHNLVYSSRGFAYAMIKKYRQAIKDLTKDIEQNPDVAATYFYRGECYILSHNAQQPSAIRDFSKAIELKPDYAEAYLSRAKARSFMGLVTRYTGDYADALSDYHKFLELAPEHPEAKNCGEVMAILERKIRGTT
jgi:tetratricopeptide (TPR) repeat protein